MNKRIMIALGGNALGNNAEQQQQIVKKTANILVSLVKRGYQIVISHGNGPQIGMINAALNQSSDNSMPFAECCAMTQGYIGYHLQQAMQNELNKQHINIPCITLATQILVDKADPAFMAPSKPIGAFYSKEEALRLSEHTGFLFKEDAGRGYRRVIASPKPLSIIESQSIKHLIDSNHIVIVAGGGGIPVINQGGQLQGIDAVIDKDHASAKLALTLNIDTLLILTAVDHASLHFNLPQQQAITSITAKQARHYSQQGHFAAGSMLPKIEACIEFVTQGQRNSRAIISSLDNALLALQGDAGTTITPDPM